MYFEDIYFGCVYFSDFEVFDFVVFGVVVCIVEGLWLVYYFCNFFDCNGVVLYWISWGVDRRVILDVVIGGY